MKESSEFKVQSSKFEAAAEIVERRGRDDFELETLNFELVVDGLRKTFRDPSGGVLEVLQDVSFEMKAGETLAIVGASGAGKSTLLHVLGGLERAEGGSARLDDFDILGADAGALTRFRASSVGFVFQAHHLLPDLTAEENVALPLLVARKPWRAARREAAAMLEAVGLKERAAHGAGELSGGEQQRVAIARALVGGARLLLCDEPTGNLDARTAGEVISLLFALCRKRRACAIIATHNEALARACDRALLLQGGRLQAEG